MTVFSYKYGFKIYINELNFENLTLVITFTV